MKPTPTGIAVALAVAVIIVIFIFPSLSPFRAAPQPAPTDTTQLATTTTMTIPDATQLQITDEVVGSGATAVAGDSVTVDYVGSLTDGTVFDASKNHGTTGFTFTLGAGQVIPGWDQGLVGMKVGGTRKLIIPASLAYGSQGAGGVIPPNATLIFEVQLRSVQPAK